jgi:hypothetical protein
MLVQLILVGSYLLGVAILFLFLADLGAPLTWLALPIFYLWAVAPVGASLAICQWAKGPIPTALSSVALAANVLSGAYAYGFGLFGPGTTSTSPLIILFWPLYQGIGVLMSGALIGLTQLVGGRQ